VPSTAARRRVLPLLLALLLATVALSGCARVRAALAVQPDDSVNGEIVVATPLGPGETWPGIPIPAELQSDVDVRDYHQDDYTGSVLRFTGLTFAEVAQLQSAAGPAGSGVRLDMRRAGNRVHLTGTVDLTTVSVDRADFQLKIGFPGEVLEANGDADSNEVSWTFTPGEVGDIDAVVAFADPNAPSAVNWTLGLGALVAAAAAAVVLLARRMRNPPVSPSR
jgi:hypothetical protein